MADPEPDITQTAAAGAPGGPNADDVAVVESNPKELRNALYARCANQPADRVFDQNDLLAFGIIPNDDLGQLLSCTRRLTQEGLFKLHTKDGGACWRVVKKEDAAKYAFYLITKSAQFTHHVPQVQNA